MKRAARTNDECGHFDLPHRGRGMCNACYVDYRRSYMRDYAETQRTDWTRHEGVIRTGVKGWGSLT
jgi:hypothetical protein